MAAFIVRRLAWMVLVMFAISVIVFAIFFLTPGVDPARQMAGRNPTPQTKASARTRARIFGEARTRTTNATARAAHTDRC